MRVLVTTQPGYGHLYPLVPAARALVAAGHEVLVATAGSFQPAVHTTGLTGVAAGLDWLMSDPQAAIPEITAYRGAAGKRFMLGEVFCGRAARAMIPDLLALSARWRPDVIVREVWEFGGAVTAALLGVPCVVHGVGTRRNAEEVAAAGHDGLRRLWTSHGQPDDPHLNWTKGKLYLDPCPSFLQNSPSQPISAAVQAIRPDPVDGSSDVELHPGARDRERRPLIYLGLGTVMHRRPRVLEALLAGLHDLPADVLVTTGPGRDPAGLEPQPPHIHLVQHASLTALLPRCDLVISHGGWGTAIAALSHGLPLICVPLGADGPDNAQRCQAAGLSVTLDPDSLRPETVLATVHRVLGAPTFRKHAQRARTTIAAMPTPADAVQPIEALR